MTDKMYVIDGDMFVLTAPGQGHVTWEESKKDWVYHEESWFNYCGPDMANRGVNMMRWLGWSVWPNWYDNQGYKTNLTPFIQVSPGIYDLSKRNNRYWEIAEQMIRVMNYPSQQEGIDAPGITLWIDLAYQYRNDNDDIKFSPWRNNVQGITDLYDPKCWPYFEAYMLEWFKLKKEKGLNIVFGMGNELGKDSLEFCYNMLDVMDKEHIWPFAWAICPEVPAVDGWGDTFKYLPKYIDDHNLFQWYQPWRGSKWWDTDVIRPTHGCCNIPDRNGNNIFQLAYGYWANHPIRWQASDDGCMGGATPRPGADLWYSMSKQICRGQALTKQWNEPIEYPMIGIEHLPDDEPWPTCREQQLKIFEAMISPYESNHGPLANHGKWSLVYVKPECQIGEVKSEVCWDGSVNVTHTCVNGKFVPTGTTCPVKPSHKCGKDKWYQHLKPFGNPTWNFKGAFEHATGKHDW
jgi:hypothetical protein